MPSYTLTELADKIGAAVIGDATAVINGIATIDAAQPGQVTVLYNSQYAKYLADTQASAVVMLKDDADKCPVPALIVSNPHYAYAQLAALFDNAAETQPGIHSSAIVDITAHIHSSASIGPHCVISKNVVIDEGVSIEAGCYIGENTKIAKHTRLHPHVTIYRSTQIGERCIIHSGVVLASDGFGFAFADKAWYKIAQLGGVIIGNDVEIGANTTIDRGSLGNTIIEDGVKLDNQIQIAHNVKIGAHTIMAGCVGVAGSTEIGKYCQIAGRAGFVGHIKIADHTVITAAAVITKSITQPGVYSSGTAMQEMSEWKKNAIRFKQLDKMAQRLDKLENLMINQSEKK